MLIRSACLSRENLKWLLKSVFLVFAAGSVHASTCNQLASLPLPLASVASATEEHSADEQSYCRVLITATPVPDSEIHIEIWLPDANR